MTPSPLTISKRVQRRFILGLQGLWPGRRWRGKSGILDAVRECEAIQVDPVNILCASHDLALWGRVFDYTPADLDSCLYTDHQLFDYGGNLNIYPMSERPYWMHVMELRKEEKRWKEFAQSHPDLIDAVYAFVKTVGPSRKRDLDGEAVENYRGGKDTGVALYYLWLTGALMSRGRVGRERVYDLAQRVAPKDALQPAPTAEAIDFLLRKNISQSGLITASYFASLLRGLSRARIDRAASNARLEAKLAGNELFAIKVHDQRGMLYGLTADLPLLETLHSGDIPAAWAPRETTTLDEVVFLSPLERVSARGRAKKLFDFDYTWEIYKPDAERRYGPYTLPVLFGDRLVARIDSKFDRETNALIINGFWPEPGLRVDSAFSFAFTNGLERLTSFLGSASLDASAVREHGDLFT